MARGYDNYVLNQELLLDLQFSEGTGTNVQDWAKPHHVCTTVGTPPTWAALGNGLPYLDFDLTAPRDHIISLAGVTADLNFTAGDFSCAVWVRPDASGEREFFTRGAAANDGWGFYYSGGNALNFYTAQAGASQFSSSPAATVIVGTWQLVGVTRSGATARLYMDGVEVTSTYATHINPLTSARNLYIGCTDAVGAGWYDGDMWRPRIWSRQLSAAEMASIFITEHHLLGL